MSKHKFCCTKIENLSVNLGKEVLKDVNIHIHCGQLTAIVGPNGAGKSTLLKALVGGVPYSGRLLFMDEKGDEHKPIIGYVPQKLHIEKDSPVSVLDFLTAPTAKRAIFFGIHAKDKQLAINSLKIAGGAHLIKKRMADLSGGELQRVLLAHALYPSPPNLLLLDEPISGIDPEGVQTFWETINTLRLELDIAIIIVSHDLEEVKKYANTAILLNKGVVKSGDPKDVL